MERSIKEKYDVIKTIEQRLSLLVGSRLRHRDKILKAIEKMAEINKKLTAQIGDFNGVAEIRKWRDAGCM
ncbi:hypothetical protein HZB07_06680 [Candidatus Saganbacteria bacterium]|nr:hypothetical protein [Candidatus Saganbacteria bacterium]